MLQSAYLHRCLYRSVNELQQNVADPRDDHSGGVDQRIFELGRRVLKTTFSYIRTNRSQTMVPAAAHNSVDHPPLSAYSAPHATSSAPSPLSAAKSPHIVQVRAEDRV